MKTRLKRKILHQEREELMLNDASISYEDLFRTVRDAQIVSYGST